MNNEPMVDLIVSNRKDLNECARLINHDPSLQTAIALLHEKMRHLKWNDAEARALRVVIKRAIGIPTWDNVLEWIEANRR